MLLPDMIEDFVGENNPARFIDTFVDSIDLHDLGFKYSVFENGAGRPSYDPHDLLKIYLWGYTMPYVLQGNLSRNAIATRRSYGSPANSTRTSRPYQISGRITLTA